MPCAVEEVTVSKGFHIEKTNGYNKSIIQQIQSKTKKQDSDIKTLELCNNLENNPANLVLVSDYVKEKGNDKIHLPESKVTSDMYIRICGLDGTIYKGEKYMFDDWEQLYLEKPTKMEVLGILESPKGMVPLPQWVVLVAEDGHVYGYGDEYLQLFATSLKEMIQNGIQDTGISYDYPHDLSDEEEEVLEQDEEIQRRRQKTKEFIDKDADEFNDFLNSF